MRTADQFEISVRSRNIHSGESLFLIQDPIFERERESFPGIPAEDGDAFPRVEIFQGENLFFPALIEQKILSGLFDGVSRGEGSGSAAEIADDHILDLKIGPRPGDADGDNLFRGERNFSAGDAVDRDFQFSVRADEIVLSPVPFGDLQFSI